MEPIWIILLVVAAIIVGIGVALAVRHRRSGDYNPHLDPRDNPNRPEHGRTAEAIRHVDRTGFGAGGSF
ncbi:hypothetical protein [Herbiconiux sp.]|jgi:hypothetical protein|uniref:hypothetical protein n=1 Tax=Herbiconiux sp. TaxID=1871186 RepID=UPI0025BA6B20|nr:hypothetical protein [Herbiconiux sp.]